MTILYTRILGDKETIVLNRKYSKEQLQKKLKETGMYSDKKIKEILAEGIYIPKDQVMAVKEVVILVQCSKRQKCFLIGQEVEIDSKARIKKISYIDMLYEIFDEILDDIVRAVSGE